tara:strand:- start:1144 stop:1788 length:645 start_codon:yes stop_codon:yes gene_type:complete
MIRNTLCIASINKVSYEKYLSKLNPELVICVGPAGTGKTMLACKHSMMHLNNKNYNKLIITRPSVSVEEDIGYLPGEINQKMYPYLIPIYENLEKFSDKSTIIKNLKNNVIEIVPLGYLRGRTFDNTIIIADEMQNASHNQMMTLLTRIGYNSKTIITGDLDQCDLPKTNGLKIFLDKLNTNKNNIENIEVIKFDSDDIQRSELVKSIINIYKT